MTVKRGNHGTIYYAFGDDVEAAKEYERFQGCLLQLTDADSMLGDMTNRWVIFQAGWVFGLSSYPTEQDALAFARQIFRNEPDAVYIIAQVDPERHALSAMHLLASALSDVESNEQRTGKKARHPEVPENDDER